jgi:uncharacterized membrane protein
MKARSMTTWEIVRWLHLLAMAFFVGGQIMLVAAVLPSLRGGEDDRVRLRAVARRFGWGSLVALLVLLATGAAMADHFGRWSDGTLQVKLVLVAVAGLLVLIHMRRPNQHWLEGAVFVVSLAIVWLGVSLTH